LKPLHFPVSQFSYFTIAFIRMTLLLGPPSSGKTTLLLALAGKLDPDLKVSGHVTYNGHGMNEFVPQRTDAYTSRHDFHIGEMTVRENLGFLCKVPKDLLSELSRREIATNIKPDPNIDIYMKAVASVGQEANQMVTEYVLKILGLEMCADIVVGDEMLRGISGGQTKCVTTGEMLVGPTNALFMDVISSGLDSSTTVQIVKCLRQIVHILDGTAVISLLQPEPETYELFDDIILLSDGQIVYQGPREFVLEFFESKGFRCPERKAIFLQEVSKSIFTLSHTDYGIESKNMYLCMKSEYQIYLYSMTCDFKEGSAVPFDKRKNHPVALTTKKYGVLPNSTESLEVEALESRGFFTHASWYWIGAGALLGFVVLLNITFTLALTYLNPLEKPRAVIFNESHGNRHKDRTLDDIGLSLRFTGNAPSSNI
ncbi:ABC transporter G family member 53 isoform E, partial [Glycine soja]